MPLPAIMPPCPGLLGHVPDLLNGLSDHRPQFIRQAALLTLLLCQIRHLLPHLPEGCQVVECASRPRG